MHTRLRILVVTLDAAGNWPPELALIRALVERGHAVRVISDAAHAGSVEAAGAQFTPYRHVPDGVLASVLGEPEDAERMRVLQDVFFNAAFADEVRSALDDESPDVLLVDGMPFFGLAAAERAPAPSIVLWHTVYGATARNPMWAALREPVNGIRRTVGLAPLEEQRGLFSGAEAVLAFTWERFDVAIEPRPDNLHYVGPLGCAPSAPTSFELPWPSGDSRPLVLVSYSTSFQRQTEVLQRLADAVEGLPVRVLLTLGPAIDAAQLRLPDNVVAERFVPHAAVLPHARLVITHAGHGTVMAAVTAGVPLLCTPMGRDQPLVAVCVEERNLGHVLQPSATVDELRRAIATALADEDLPTRARQFAAGLDLDAGRQRAVEVVETVARRDRQDRTY